MSDDPRPLHSPMPEHLVPILERHGMAVMEAVGAAYQEVIASEHYTAGRTENDALSLQSELAAYAALILVRQLSACKGVTYADVIDVAFLDIYDRAQRLVAGLGEGAHGV